MKIQGKIVNLSFRSILTNPDLMTIEVKIKGVISRDQIQKEYESFAQSHKVQITENRLGEYGDLGYEILMEVIE